ncbi:Uncharacterised protein [Actinobacillus delphinicola]|uniref:Uncharacterized protein n=1 Tax=Actinobacillus delphinicola TaxID=51161 RepID=A0A448TVW8_9PAST|nr:Uncharacterised protein [Actinobacillus delphinicola]
MTNKINRPVSDTKKSLSSRLSNFVKILTSIYLILNVLARVIKRLIDICILLEMLWHVFPHEKLIDILTWYTSASYPTKQPDSKSNYD